jgi:hypothetical protein
MRVIFYNYKKLDEIFYQKNNLSTINDLKHVSEEYDNWGTEKYQSYNHYFLKFYY